MKILLLADYYPRYLDSFYKKHDATDLSYERHLDLLLSDYFGSFVSYYNHFKNIGHDTRLIIGNDARLQNKWLSEKGMKPGRLTKYDIVLKQTEDFKPDAFYLGSMFDYYGDFLQNVSSSARNIFAWIACPFSRSLDFSNITCILSSVEGFVDQFRKRGLQAEVLKPAFDPDIINQLDNNTTIDVSFVGGLSRKTHLLRVQGLEYVIKSGFDVNIFGYGLGHPIYFFHDRLLRKQYLGERWGLEMYRTLNKSKISLNFHIDIVKDFAGNMRLFEATGCRSLMITEHADDIDRLFIPGREVITYQSNQDLVEKIRYYLEHDTEREEIAAAGQKACLTRHGYDKRIREFEQILLKYID